MVFKKPFWTEQGPGPLSLPSTGFEKSTGAIQAIVVDPVNPERVFVASVGGGIWMSTDAASAANPTWVPQSDFAPSLTMSALAMSPLDPNGNTLYAGSGRTSHGDPRGGPRGGPLFGLLKTVDGGTHWNEIARTEFQGKFVSRIVPLGVRTNQGDRVLVGTLEGGLHISDDGGLTWTRSSHVASFVTDIVAEPTNASTVYVAAPPHIWRSDDGAAADWHDVTPPEWAALFDIAARTFRFAVSPGTDFHGTHWIYVSATNADKQFPLGGFSVVVSSDRGATWSPLGMAPDSSSPGSPMAVSPLFPDVLFVPTDAGSPDHYMATFSQGDDTQWTLIENAGANGTAPHTDGRDCAFALDGSLMFETNDGGISRLSNPHSSQRQWSQVVGNLRTAEFLSVAYDSVNHIIFGATQDNAIPQQTLLNSWNWEMNELPIADGMCVGVDVISTPGAAIHYSSQQSLYLFVRRTYTGPMQVTASELVGGEHGPVISGTGGLHYNKVEGNLGTSTVRANQDWVVNEADPTRLLLGTDFLYESFDRGDTFTALGGLAKNANNDWIPANAIGAVSAYAYGHSANPNVIYVGAGGTLMLRTAAGGPPGAVVTYPGGAPVGIALDSTDWRRAYVLDSSGRVFRTFDAGATAGGWAELSGDLPHFTGDLRSIVAMPRKTVGFAEVILVAGYGGVYITENPGNGRYAMWRKHGSNFPNAVVTQINYSAADDILVAGTYGRAAWAILVASATIVGEPKITILTNQSNTCIPGWIEGSIVTFSLKIDGAASLAAPLTYQWMFPGATTQQPLTNPKVAVTIPAAGTEVVAMVRVIDATGYQLVSCITGMAITLQIAVLRKKLCELVAKIRHEEIWRPYVNPWGPDDVPSAAVLTNSLVQFGTGIAPNAIAGLPDYARLQRLINSFSEILGELAKTDRLKASQPTLYQMSASAVRHWAALEAATGRAKVRLGPSDGSADRNSPIAREQLGGAIDRG